MLKDIFPIAFKRYAALPLLGSLMDDFSEFIQRLGYTSCVTRCYLRELIAVDKRLRRLKCHSITKITRSMLLTCAPPPGRSQDNIPASAVVKLLERYLDKQKIFPPVPLTPVEKKLACYSEYLKDMRSLSSSTIQDHCLTISRFLVFLSKRNKFPYLQKLSSLDIEDFIGDIEGAVGRHKLQCIVSNLRTFLRFLGMKNEAPAGLENLIDTPRVYHGEKLPRSLDWQTVDTLLKSIDRSTAIGRRDYSILLLIATYGLRRSEIIDLKLEDIKWRENRLKVYQRKTATSLILPLTDAAGESIINYIRQGRPPTTYREIFVRHRAPHRILGPNAISKVFCLWLRRSGIVTPFNVNGVHCLRHSFALQLLRQGNSLKTIGDILGHRNFESTCVYLRLNIDDLRAVPLSLPIQSLSNQEVLP